MNTRKTLLTLGALTILISVSQQTAVVAADQTTVQEVIEKGPAQVVDSWMEPKLVRSREVKDADGNTTVINEPLIQERHEQVVVPTSKTTVTTTVHQEPAVIKTEKRLVSQAPKKKAVKKRAYKSRKVAAKPKPKKRQYVALREVVREEVKPATTTVIQQTEQSQGIEETYERRHPALEIIH